MTRKRAPAHVMLVVVLGSLGCRPVVASSSPPDEERAGASKSSYGHAPVSPRDEGDQLAPLRNGEDRADSGAGGAPSGAFEDECPSGTRQSAFGCAHAPVACTTWDGVRCDPPARERADDDAARRELQRVDAKAAAVCLGGNSPRYRGSYLAVLLQAEAGDWKATAIAADLHDIAERHDRPLWRIAAASRTGSVFDCVAVGLLEAEATPGSAAEQRRLVDHVAARRASTLLSTPPPPRAKDPTRDDTEGAWRLGRELVLGMARSAAIDGYIEAVVLGRRYALDGGFLDAPRRRLPFWEEALGEAQMERRVDRLTDPTDPARRRKLRYVPGMFEHIP